MLVIERCSTPMESRKRQTPRESSLAAAALTEFLARNKAPRQIISPINCLRSCPVGRLEGAPEELDDDITMVAIHVKS